MTPGRELRTARKRLRLSREQISLRTKIQVPRIAALENDAYNELPAGIYLDGIVAAYAREVGLDADALVRRVRMQVAPPPPETLERIVAVRHPAPVDRRRSTPGPTVAQGMTAFAAVAVLLVIAGIGVQLFPGLFEAAPQEARTARTRPVTEQAAVPDPLAEPSTPPAMSHPAPKEAVDVAIQPPAAARSTLTGAWTLETEIESSSLKAYEGLRLGYRLELRQSGERIEGTGLKVAENGVPLSGPRRTAITVHGTLGEGRVRLTFGEQGARRRTTGTLDLVIDEPGVLRGGFASEAARSAGAAQARRL